MLHSIFYKHIKALIFKNDKNIAHKAFEEKNKHIKDFDRQVLKIKHMNGFIMSKIKPHEKKIRFFGIKFQEIAS